MRCVFVSALLLGCSSTPVVVEAPAAAPIAPAEEPAPKPWVNDVATMRATAPSWTSAQFVTNGTRVSIEAADLPMLARIVSECEADGGWAATTPPWSDTVIEARVGDAVVAVFQLQAQGLRLDRAEPYAPSLASMHAEGGPTVEDCTLLDTDGHDWIWQLHDETLGPATTKEYSAPPPLP